MKKLALLILPVPLLVVIWLLRCVVGYAYTPQVYESTDSTLTVTSTSGTYSGTVTYHKYNFFPESWTESAVGISNYGTYNFRASFPVTFEFNIPSLDQGQVYSGHIDIPYSCVAYLNEDLRLAINGGHVAGGNFFVEDTHLTIIDSGSDSVRFSQFSSSTTNFLTVYFDNWQYMGGIEVVAQYSFSCMLALNDISVINDSDYTPPFNVTISNPGRCQGYIEQSSSLQQAIINGINGASDIDTMLTRLNSAVSYLTSIKSDTAALLSQVNSINGILSSIYSEIQSNSGQYDSAFQDVSNAIDDLRSLLVDILSGAAASNPSLYSLITFIEDYCSEIPALLELFQALVAEFDLTDNSSLKSRVLQIVSHLINIRSAIGYTGSGNDTIKQGLANIRGGLTYLAGLIEDPNDGFNYLYAINSKLSDLSDCLSVLRNMYTTLGNMYSYQHRLLNAITGLSTVYPSSDASSVAAATRQNWISIITEALNNVQVRIEIDQDIYQNIQITNNDIKNYYYDQDIVQNFNVEISDLWSQYITTIDFTALSPGNLPPNIAGAVTSGKTLIERMYNTFGDFTFLITVTLLIGLVAALLGPINRFVSSRIGRSKE